MISILRCIILTVCSLHTKKSNLLKMLDFVTKCTVQKVIKLSSNCTSFEIIKQKKYFTLRWRFFQSVSFLNQRFFYYKNLVEKITFPDQKGPLRNEWWLQHERLP
jgi:hypothetical protein